MTAVSLQELVQVLDLVLIVVGIVNKNRVAAQLIVQLPIVLGDTSFNSIAKLWF